YATEIVDPAAPQWQVVAQGQGAIRGLTATRDGHLYFPDPQAIRKPAPAAAAVSLFTAATDVRSLAFAADGRRLFAALEGPSGIAVFDAAGHRALVEAGGPG